MTDAIAMGSGPTSRPEFAISSLRFAEFCRMDMSTEGPTNN